MGIFPVQKQELWTGLLLLCENIPSAATAQATHLKALLALLRITLQPPPTQKDLGTYTKYTRHLHQSSPAFTKLLSNPKFTERMDMSCRAMQSTLTCSVSQFRRRKQVTVPCRYL